MDNISEYISKYTDPTLSSEEQEDALRMLLPMCDISDITTGNNQSLASLPTLIKLMGQQLTSENAKERNRATLLLSEVLHQSPVCISHPPSLCMLITFYTSRLHDYPAVNPCLHGLISLFDRHIPSMLESVPVPADGVMAPAVQMLPVMDIFQALDMSLPSPVQGLAQSIRHKIFSLLLSICSCADRHHTSRITFDIFNGIDEEKARAEHSLMSIVCNSVDGEKDPRCLLLTLRLVRATLTLLPDCIVSARGAGLASRVYGCVACYFPITFTPPPFVSPEDAVTPAQLVSALEEVLCCHSGLFEHTVPFLIDQLVEALDTSDASVAEQSNTIVQALAALARTIDCAMVGPGPVGDAAVSALHAQLAVYHRALRDTLYSLSTSLLLDNHDIVQRCDLLLSRLAEFGVLCDFRGLKFAPDGGQDREPPSGCCGGAGASGSGCCKRSGGAKGGAATAPAETSIWDVFCGWIVDNAVHEFSEQIDSLKSKNNAHLVMVLLQHCNSGNCTFARFPGCNTTNSYASEVLQAILPVLLVQLHDFRVKYNQWTGDSTNGADVDEVLKQGDVELKRLGHGDHGCCGASGDESDEGSGGGCCQSIVAPTRRFMSVTVGSTLCKSIALLLLFSRKPTDPGRLGRSEGVAAEGVHRLCVVVLGELYRALRDSTHWGSGSSDQAPSDSTHWGSGSSDQAPSDFGPFLAESVHCASNLVYTLFAGQTDPVDGGAAMQLVEAYVGRVMALVGVGSEAPAETSGPTAAALGAAEEFVSSMVNWPTALRPAFEKMCLQPLVEAVRGAVAGPSEVTADLKVLVACLSKIAGLSTSSEVALQCTDCVLLPALNLLQPEIAVSTTAYSSILICLDAAGELLAAGSEVPTTSSSAIAKTFLPEDEAGRGTVFSRVDALLRFSALPPPSDALDGTAVACAILRLLVAAATTNGAPVVVHDRLIEHVWGSSLDAHSAGTCSLSTLIGVLEASLASLQKNSPLLVHRVGSDHDTIFITLLTIAKTRMISDDVLWARICRCVFLVLNKTASTSVDCADINAMLEALFEVLVVDKWGYSLTAESTASENGVVSILSDERAASMFLWAAKALYMRSNVAGPGGTWQEIFTRLVRTFIDLASARGGDVETCRTSARGAQAGQCIVAHMDILCVESGVFTSALNINPVWRQKLWSVLVSPMLEELSSPASSTAARYKLLAVTTFATHTPVGAMGKYHPGLWGRLVRCVLVGLGGMKSPADQVVSSRCVELLLVLLEALASPEAEAEDEMDEELSVGLLTPHLNTLLPALVQCTRSERCGEAVQRYRSLRCLELLLTCTVAMTRDGTGVHSTPQQNIALLVPYKSQVIKQLASCLGDKKRAVRLLTVRVRNMWILLL